SLNNYDYAGQDPITKYDLDGTMLAISGSQERQMQEDRDALINDSTLLFGQFGPTIGDVAVTARADHLKSACKAMTDCELHPRTCLQDMSPVQSSAVQRDSHKYAGARNGNVARGVKDACGLAGHALLGLSAVTKLDPWVSVPCVAFDFAVAINDIF
ncbi:MAG TPA: hypothetical protein VFW85_01550, partial [Gaiellaceae bacterium]|nr:hypothetical protein [Gaiellaceae bacterium]